jgi:hypothetical protein
MNFEAWLETDTAGFRGIFSPESGMITRLELDGILWLAEWHKNTT